MYPNPTGWLAKFLTLFFDLLYHQFAWTYDLVSWTVSIGMWNGWIRSVIPAISENPILELGHGPGHLQKALHQNGFSPTGLDRSPQMGWIAQRRLTNSALPFQLVNGSAAALPFPNDCFNHIVATFPTEYIVEPNTISEIYRILKPGKELLIIPMAVITGGSILHKAAAWLFKVTGQAGETDQAVYQSSLQRYTSAGFDISIEWQEQNNSRVMFVRAKKQTK